MGANNQTSKHSWTGCLQLLETLEIFWSSIAPRRNFYIPYRWSTRM